MRVSWELKYMGTCVCECTFTCVRMCVCSVISSYLIAKVIYYLEEESKGLKIVLSFTHRYKTFSNFDAHFDIFILNDFRTWPFLLM